MKNILLIQSSPRGLASYSQKVARSIVSDLEERYLDAKVVVRDLAQNPPPHVGEAFVGGISTGPEQRTPEQTQALASSDVLIDELLAADVMVFAVPMHNFGLPSTLKAWIDHVVRLGRTVAYSSEKGPEGMLKGKRAILVLASGGVYSDGPAKPLDFQEPYLRAILGFIGLTDVDVVRVEGIAVSAIGPEKAMASALAQSREIP
ncbi:MAG TPA: FMN-dependent NADH-azoreductase [Verrucomicrobiae bacterium]|nr:FMN-dependent NADH-azoreductase [Verrucomicrobiae bacterium]